MRQRVSELMDSELGESAAAQVMTAIEADASLKQAWNDYHLIGDVMRANTHAAIDVRHEVSVRLKAEPTVLAPRRWHRVSRVRVAGAAALAASVSFAAVVAWQQLSGPQHAAVMVNAQAQQPAALQAVSGSNADAYFLAHQELTADQGLVQVAYSRRAAH
ncbi:sigma-E factor negative regulatory protein [Paludibacterium purpuratum]|uniref:RseA-like anti sigma(E) protein n=1 Tax=Paludibacterium purpuratum TaxID=1144873 RepID=A0A4R7B5D4_9NEIS|nr:sigma-E factor negative regulatory protein [Paludibacterium purpuratum]TDR79880.1 RseA-like anti sigma(E) protein [Paludibacterium purpuratum]